MASPIITPPPIAPTTSTTSTPTPPSMPVAPSAPAQATPAPQPVDPSTTPGASGVTVRPGNADDFAARLRERMTPQPPTPQAQTQALAPVQPPPPSTTPVQSTPAPAPVPADPPAFALDSFDFDDPANPSTSQSPTPAPALPAQAADPTTPTPPGSAPSTTPPGDGVPSSTPPLAEGGAPTDLSDPQLAALAKILAEGGLPKEVETAFLSTQRGRRILDQFKATRQLALPPDQGGIGMVPTPDQIKEWSRSATNWEQSAYEFEANPQSWLRNWLAPDAQTGQFAPSVPTLAESFLPELARLDRTGQLFERALAPAINFTSHDLRQWAQSIPEGLNPDSFGVDERTRVLDAADILEARYRARAGGMVGPTPSTATFTPSAPAAPSPGAPTSRTTPTTPSSADPLAAERARLEAERRHYEEQSRLIAQQAETSVFNQIDGNIRSSISGDLDKLFTASGVKAGMPSPDVYNLFLDQHVGRVIELVAGDRTTNKSPMNPDGFSRFRISYNRALQSARSPRPATDPTGNPYVSQSVEAFRQLARTAIRMIAPDAIKAAGIKIQESRTPAAPAIARYEAAAQQTEPAPSGPAVQQSLAPPTRVEIQPGESRADATARMLAQIMTNAAAQGRR
jgi:hypothetical protein